jgi:hypothetical protein
MILSYPPNGSVQRFALRLSLFLNRSLEIDRTLVALSTRDVSARSERSQHVLSHSLVSMTSVPRRSWRDLGDVVAVWEAMLVRNRLNIMRIPQGEEDSLCG